MVTDHSSLRWLNSLKDPAGRLARWATSLQAYNFTIVHRKGALHHVSDALSRALEDEFVGAIDPGPLEDNWYQQKLSQLREFPSRFPDWKEENGLLWINRKNPELEPILVDLDSWKLVVPTRDRERVLFESHNTPESGHLGIEKTYQRVTQRYYWPGVY